MTARHPGLAGAFGILWLLASSANAQEITTAPVATVPVDNPWALGLLVVAFLAGAFVVLHRSSHRMSLMALLSVGLATGMLWQSPDLRAQVVLMFTDPGGETLPIAVDTVMSNGDIVGFVPADFVNQSGNTLRIAAITPPTFAQCFPSGAGNLQPPGPPDPDPPASCSVDRTLPSGAGCRVDVDSVCRDLAAATPPLSSINSLALAVDAPGEDPPLPGNARQIVFTNTVSGAVVGLQVSVSGLPAGTIISNNTCVGTLAAGASCTVTITPGASASHDVSANACTGAPGTEPVPGIVSLHSHNAPPSDVNVLVLGYGCIYEGGYLFAVDDSTPAFGSIGGKVAALSDENSAQWATSLAETNADSLYDGPANSAVLGADPGDYPAAQACLNQSAAGYTDWYLPAICELGRFVGLGTDAGCGNNSPNLYTTLHLGGRGGFGNDLYWSSTESSADPVSSGWIQSFDVGIQATANKTGLYRVRCIRQFSP
ncbi:MAG: midcut-by-XrtH protein [Wenzhouxiangella sp.]